MPRKLTYKEIGDIELAFSEKPHTFEDISGMFNKHQVAYSKGDASRENDLLAGRIIQLLRVNPSDEHAKEYNIMLRTLDITERQTATIIKNYDNLDNLEIIDEEGLLLTEAEPEGKKGENVKESRNVVYENGPHVLRSGELEDIAKGAAVSFDGKSFYNVLWDKYSTYQKEFNQGIVSQRKGKELVGMMLRSLARYPDDAHAGEIRLMIQSLDITPAQVDILTKNIESIEYMREMGTGGEATFVENYNEMRAFMAEKMKQPIDLDASVDASSEMSYSEEESVVGKDINLEPEIQLGGQPSSSILFSKESMTLWKSEGDVADVYKKGEEPIESDKNRYYFENEPERVRGLRKKFEYTSYIEDRLAANDERERFVTADDPRRGSKLAEIAGDRLAVYSALKKRSEERSWGEVFKHPFKTFKEWRIKNKAKDVLKEKYNLTDATIDELADYRNGTKNASEYEGLQNGKIKTTTSVKTAAEKAKAIDDDKQPILGLKEDVEGLNKTNISAVNRGDLNRSKSKVIDLD